MIYFDNAATTLLKPKLVHKSMQELSTTCANAGRSGHKPSMKSSQVIFDTRQSVCNFFGLEEPENIIFTYNATYALNLAIKGFICEKCTVITSGFEHNSTIRPLMAMDNVHVVINDCKLYDNDGFLKKFKENITDDVKFAVINHVSNVFGYILPIKEIDEICYQNNIKLILDISQSAGILPINLSEFKSVVAVCMPAHKSLYGPLGVGVLVLIEKPEKSLIQGGTGSLSSSVYQPDFLPDMLETGTPNAPAIGALKYGIEYVLKSSDIQRKLFNYVKFMASKLEKEQNTVVFFNDDIELQTGVLSFYNKSIDNEILAEKLAQFDICTRAGFHCSPLAHKSANTQGTVRISFSTFNNFDEIEKFVHIYNKILSR